MNTTRKPKRRPPLSIRLNEAEHADLCRRAGDVPLSTYIKRTLFEGREVRARYARHRVAGDRKQLAQILAMIGRTRLRESLDDLAGAARCGSLLLDDSARDELVHACADIRTIYRLLLQALGMDSDGGGQS